MNPDTTDRINRAPIRCDINGYTECAVAAVRSQGWWTNEGDFARAAHCVDLGSESEAVEKRLRIVSSVTGGPESSVAVVQLNEHGAYAVNAWEVQ